MLFRWICQITILEQETREIFGIIPINQSTPSFLIYRLRTYGHNGSGLLINVWIWVINLSGVADGKFAIMYEANRGNFVAVGTPNGLARKEICPEIGDDMAPISSLQVTQGVSRGTEAPLLLTGRLTIRLCGVI